MTPILVNPSLAHTEKFLRDHRNALRAGAKLPQTVKAQPVLKRASKRKK